MGGRSARRPQPSVHEREEGVEGREEVSAGSAVGKPAGEHAYEVVAIEQPGPTAAGFREATAPVHLERVVQGALTTVSASRSLPECIKETLIHSTLPSSTIARGMPHEVRS